MAAYKTTLFTYMMNSTSWKIVFETLDHITIINIVMPTCNKEKDQELKSSTEVYFEKRMDGFTWALASQTGRKSRRLTYSFFKGSSSIVKMAHHQD